MGKLVAGSFRDGIQPLDTQIQREMLYMQSQLDLSMKSEFDNSLGSVNYVVTHRENVALVAIPLTNQANHVLISSERIADIPKIVDDVINSFATNRRCSPEQTPSISLHS